MMMMIAQHVQLIFFPACIPVLSLPLHTTDHETSLLFQVFKKKILLISQIVI